MIPALLPDLSSFLLPLGASCSEGEDDAAFLQVLAEEADSPDAPGADGVAIATPPPVGIDPLLAISVAPQGQVEGQLAGGESEPCAPKSLLREDKLAGEPTLPVVLQPADPEVATSSAKSISPLPAADLQQDPGLEGITLDLSVKTTPAEKKTPAQSVAEAVITFQAQTSEGPDTTSTPSVALALPSGGGDPADHRSMTAAHGHDASVLRQVRAAILPEARAPDVTPVDGPRKIELRLDPEELGRLSITLSPEGETVTVHLSAERPETIDLLRRHAEQLHQELRAAGFREAQMSFGQMAQGGGGPPPRPQQTALAEGAGIDAAPPPHMQPQPLAPANPGGLNLRL